MSNLTLVNDALALIGVLPEGQDATADQGQTALALVSKMVEEWADDGISVNWNSAASLDDECPLAGVERTAVEYQLAVRLCPLYERDPRPTLVALASATYQKLQRIQLVRSLEAIGTETSLPVPEGVRAHWDITLL